MTKSWESTPQLSEEICPAVLSPHSIPRLLTRKKWHSWRRSRSKVLKGCRLRSIRIRQTRQHRGRIDLAKCLKKGPVVMAGRSLINTRGKRRGKHHRKWMRLSIITSMLMISLKDLQLGKQRIYKVFHKI